MAIKVHYVLYILLLKNMLFYYLRAMIFDTDNYPIMHRRIYQSGEKHKPAFGTIQRGTDAGTEWNLIGMKSEGGAA
ncbi:MAG: hypothetical protein WEC12_00405 [Balneolaceae bacterium]